MEADPVKLVVDCDPGIDDAIALAYLAGEAEAGKVDLRAVIAVRGNLDVDTTARNAAFMLDRLGLEHIPVYRGAAEAITPLDEEIDATAFHGPDGLGGQHDRSHTNRSVPLGAEGIVDLLSGAVGAGSDLLAVGPLTNVAWAIRADPNLAPSIGRLVVMGGAFGNPGGNITPHAEYNFHLDAGAAREVMASDIPTTLIPLDVTHQVLIRPQHLEALPHTERGDLARALLEASIEIHAREMGLEGCIMHDALAAAVTLHPDLMTTTAGAVRVESAGGVSGQSRLDPDATRATVAAALEVDVDAARTQILDSLERL